MKFDGTDTYPVGVLHALQRSYRVLTIPEFKGRRRDRITGIVGHEARLIRRWASEGDWRAVRNTFNGYLSEHQHGGHNAGCGWTKRAAERRVERICKAAN